MEVSAAVDVSAEGRDAIIELADVRGQQAHVEIIALQEKRRAHREAEGVRWVDFRMFSKPCFVFLEYRYVFYVFSDTERGDIGGEKGVSTGIV